MLARAMLIAVSLASLLSVTAHASHYALTKVAFVNRHERQALARVGVLDTEVLLSWVADRERRTWLAAKTHIAEARLRAWAGACDLLRVEGIGPTILPVLMKAHVDDTRALGMALPALLLKAMRSAARGTPMETRLPAEDTLGAWIEEARLLRPLIR